MNSKVIDDRFLYGESVTLVCSKCGARFNTKNINCIGARSIFDGEVGAKNSLKITGLTVRCNELDHGSECLRVMTDEEFEGYDFTQCGYLADGKLLMVSDTIFCSGALLFKCPDGITLEQYSCSGGDILSTSEGLLELLDLDDDKSIIADNGMKFRAIFDQAR